MGRRNRPKRDEPTPVDVIRASGGRRTESKRGEDWVVQDITEARAIKEYVCPGCVITIEIGVPHVVTWHYEGYLVKRPLFETAAIGTRHVGKCSDERDSEHHRIARYPSGHRIAH